jgi:hypothetical protein
MILFGVRSPGPGSDIVGDVVEWFETRVEAEQFIAAVAPPRGRRARVRRPPSGPRRGFRGRHARFCREAKDVAPGEALAVLALLGLLGGMRGKPAARALSELLYRRGTEPAAEALMRWSQ